MNDWSRKKLSQVVHGTVRENPQKCNKTPFHISLFAPLNSYWHNHYRLGVEAESSKFNNSTEQKLLLDLWIVHDWTLFRRTGVHVTDHHELKTHGLVVHKYKLKHASFDQVGIAAETVTIYWLRVSIWCYLHSPRIKSKSWAKYSGATRGPDSFDYSLSSHLLFSSWSQVRRNIIFTKKKEKNNWIYASLLSFSSYIFDALDSLLCT